jgi:hypothetical protein
MAFSGCPFAIAGRQVFECHAGRQHKRKQPELEVCMHIINVLVINASFSVRATRSRIAALS